MQTRTFMSDDRVKDMGIYIFGAKATAAGLYKALLLLKPEEKIKAFLVSDTAMNVPELWGVPVKSLSSVAENLSENEKYETQIYAAVPEVIHEEINVLLTSYGFRNIVILDSRLEAKMMGRYFDKVGRFKSVHSLEANGESYVPQLTIYMASFYKDKPLNNPQVLPGYIKSLFLGCDGAVKAGIDIGNKADFYDNKGDNISEKNPNRCEMTAHYWIWKNRLDTDDEYVGICHYRRILELDDEDLKKITGNDVDVVLPYPMIHYPNAGKQHTWYVPDKDWDLMKQVVNELYPEYGERFDEVFSVQEFYNYNMMLAKKSVFADYCGWLYPILDRIEELSEPKGIDRHDRYTAYLSESLTTLYYMVNMNGLKIYHTGRLLFT